jgi:hypothetical protein
MNTNQVRVITAISNPIGWQSRIKLYKEFEQHILDSGVKLTVVECAYGERDYQLLPTSSHVTHIPVRAYTAIWNKENLMNIGINRSTEKYIVTADADIEFRKSGWPIDVVHALQLHPVIQPWSDAYDLGPNDEHMQHHVSFASQFVKGVPVIPNKEKMWKFNNGPYDYPHPGFVWAWTRQALDWVGGLLEVGGMGSGDHHMALGLVGGAEYSLPEKVSQNYKNAVMQWQDRAVRHINYNLGYTQGTIEHFYHGQKAKRNYTGRWDMFVKHNFDPHTDLKRNSYGVAELTGNKPDLQREFLNYLKSRDEDNNSLG